MAEKKQIGTKDKSYDKAAFATLVARLKGSRTASAMAKDTELSDSFISKSLNQQLMTRPTRRTLVKLVDSKSNPQARVSLKDLLRVCGYPEEYDGSEEEEEMLEQGMDSRHPGKVSPFEAISLWYDGQSITRAMSMLVDAFIAAGIDPGLDISLKESYFEISVRGSEFKVVGIQAFCEGNSGLKIMQIVTKAKICDAFCDGSADGLMDDRYYYIVVDRKELFDFCCGLDIPARGTVVLFTENYKDFSEENIKVSDPRDEDRLPRLTGQTLTSP